MCSSRKQNATDKKYGTVRCLYLSEQAVKSGGVHVVRLSCVPAGLLLFAKVMKSKVTECLNCN